MKLIALGDIHGRGIWKQIVNDNPWFDKIVFIGDYFDAHDDISATEQIANFNEIILFKRANMDKVILLVGNHDYHYMRGVTEHYSGYNNTMAFEIQRVLHDAMDCLQMCYIYDRYMFTHAGVSRTWFENNFEHIILNPDDLQDSINDLFKYKPLEFGFTPDPDNYDPYGDSKCQTPIWIRPRSLLRDRLDGYVHVVGHTQAKELSLAMKDKVIIIDTLGTTGEYLVIKDGEPYVDC